MDALSRLGVTILVNALWQVTLVAGAAALGALLLRRAPARYRHALWALALVAAVALPLASLRRTASARIAASRSAGLGSVATDFAAPPGSPPETLVIASRTATGFWARAWEYLRDGQIPVPLPWARAIAGVEAIFLAFMLLRLARAWRRTRAIRRAAESRALPPHVLEAIARCRESVGRAPGGYEARILWSDDVHGPATLGVRRSVIVLPLRLLDADAAEDLAAALAHEMAHARRWDYLWNLLLELARLPLAFHPAAVFLKRKADESRELACDEAAAGLINPTVYARALVHMAHETSLFAAGVRRGYSLGVFDADILEERVMRILEKRPRTSARLAACLLFCGVALVAGIGMVATRYAVAAAPDESAKPSVDALAGAWKAEIGGKTFAWVYLKHEGGQWTGSIAMGHINLDNAGKVSEVTEEAQTVTRIFDVVAANGKLTFRQRDGDDVLNYALEPAGAGNARLRLLNEPPAGVRVQPFILERTSSSPAIAMGKGVAAPVVQGRIVRVSSASIVGGGVSGGVSGGVGSGVSTGVAGGVSGGVPGGSTSALASGFQGGSTVGLRGGIDNSASGGVGGSVAEQSNSESGDCSLSGVVVDASGARIPKATVDLIGRSRSFNKSVESDETGNFNFEQLPEGRYSLEVSSPGMGTAARAFDLKNEGRPPFFPFVLHPGDVVESAVVKAKAPADANHLAQVVPDSNLVVRVGPRKIRVGGNVQQAKVISGTKVSPVYPDSAKAAGLQGVVLLEVNISSDGVPEDLRVISSPGDDLSKAAEDAVRQWRYQPTLLNGDPVGVVTTVTVDFQLEP